MSTGRFEWDGVVFMGPLCIVGPMLEESPAVSTLSALLHERDELCDTLEYLGPEVPTLCEGWNAYDLAAHLVSRETDLRTIPGVMMGGLLGRFTERKRLEVKERPFGDLVATLREGPPALFRLPFSVALNVPENWIHHEDIRRANGEGPRPMAKETEDALWLSLGLTTRAVLLGVRGIGIEVAPVGRAVRRMRRGSPVARITGEVGEIVLYLSGRKSASQVEISGTEDAIDRLDKAKFGL